MKWWHTFDFPNFQTIGQDATSEKKQMIEMPLDLAGKTVLDIGCWDGYFSFLAESRGALVLANDSSKYNWNPKHEFGGKEAFNTAHLALNSSIQTLDCDAEELTEDVGKFDLVLCLGILYHMKDPWKMINLLGKITKQQVIIESWTDGNYLNMPAMIFYPNGEINNDFHTYWGPNILCLLNMLYKAGFNKLEVKHLVNSRVVIHGFK